MTYQPIDCSLHDRFEAAAVRQRPVRIRWNDSGGHVERTTTIRDVLVRDGAEYLVLDDGTTVRLDHIEGFEELPG